MRLNDHIIEVCRWFDFSSQDRIDVEMSQIQRYKAARKLNIFAYDQKPIVMQNMELSKRVKNLRTRKGLSQELLAEKSGLSLRTIQRVENSGTVPRGDTLRRLSEALAVTQEEIIDWTIKEDHNYLALMNLSALAFLLFPVLGILIPLILWITMKDRIRYINQTAKAILNFQITWNLLYFLPFLWFIFGRFIPTYAAGGIFDSIISPYTIIIVLAFFGTLYLLNILLILINTKRIFNHKNVKYFPKVKFIS